MPWSHVLLIGFQSTVVLTLFRLHCGSTQAKSYLDFQIRIVLGTNCWLLFFGFSVATKPSLCGLLLLCALYFEEHTSPSVVNLLKIDTQQKISEQKKKKRTITRTDKISRYNLHSSGWCSRLLLVVSSQLTAENISRNSWTWVCAPSRYTLGWPWSASIEYIAFTRCGGWGRRGLPARNQVRNFTYSISKFQLTETLLPLKHRKLLN